jgi:hypothetical protein
MPPRYRETYIPSPYPPPPPSPMRVKRSAPSPRPRHKAEPPPPPPPIKPFELFAAQFEVPAEGSQDGRVKEYTVDVQQEWDALTPDARLVWEAQYGRQVLEFQNATGFGTHVEEDNSAAWSTDSELDTHRVPLRERVRRKAAKGRVKKSEDGSEKGDSGVEVPSAPKATAKIMYRTESCKAVSSQFTDRANHE